MDRIVFPKKIAMTVFLSCALLLTSCYSGSKLVGGWLDTSDSLYYFDSSRLFPEDSLVAAIRFGIENGQIAVFVLSEGREVRLER